MPEQGVDLTPDKNLLTNNEVSQIKFNLPNNILARKTNFSFRQSWYY